MGRVGGMGKMTDKGGGGGGGEREGIFGQILADVICDRLGKILMSHKSNPFAQLKLRVKEEVYSIASLGYCSRRLQPLP